MYPSTSTLLLLSCTTLFQQSLALVVNVSYYATDDCAGDPITVLWDVDADTCANYFTDGASACENGTYEENKCCDLTQSSTDFTLAITNQAISAASAIALCAEGSIPPSNPCTESLSAYGSIIGNDICEKGCKDGSTTCDEDDEYYTTESCSNDACHGFLAGINQTTIQSVLQQVEPCKGYGSYYYLTKEGTIDYLLLEMVTGCGGALGPGALSPCYQSLSELSQLEVKCPKQCEDEEDEDDKDDDPKLPTCTAGQSEWAPSSCGLDECKQYLSTFNGSSIAAGFQTCTGALGAYKQHYTNDKLQFSMMHVNSQCGFSLDNIDTTDVSECVIGLTPLLTMDQKCPKVCSEKDDDDKDDSYPACRVGEDERNSTSCGTSTCATFINDMIANRNQTAAQLKSCTGELSSYAQESFSSAEQILLAGLSVASDCELNDQIEVDSLGECAQGVNVVMQFDTKCPFQCYNEGEDVIFGLEECQAGQPNRTSASCGTSTCQQFLAEVSNNFDTIFDQIKSCNSSSVDALKDIAVSIGDRENADALINNVTMLCESSAINHHAVALVSVFLILVQFLF